MNDSTINILTGPDKVRLRTGILFGDDGANAAAEMLIGIFLTEAELGFCKELSLTLFEDNSLCINSFDRGFFFDETEIQGKPRWQEIFCEIYAAPRELPPDYPLTLLKSHNTLYGDNTGVDAEKAPKTDHCFDVCAVQFASEFMHIEAVRNNEKKSLSFEKGIPSGKIRSEKCDEPQCTRIHFFPDRELFGSSVITETFLLKLIAEIESKLPDIKISFLNKSK